MLPRLATRFGNRIRFGRWLRGGVLGSPARLSIWFGSRVSPTADSVALGCQPLSPLPDEAKQTLLIYWQEPGQVQSELYLLPHLTSDLSRVFFEHLIDNGWLRDNRAQILELNR